MDTEITPVVYDPNTGIVSQSTIPRKLIATMNGEVVEFPVEPPLLPADFPEDTDEPFIL